MKTIGKSNLTFEQILSIVNRLPKNEKPKLAKELEKEVIDTKLSRLMKSFQADDLDLDILTDEVESVREEIYGKQKS
ncbi:hypothetical protein SAMN03080617_01698 [Algoriphagus alkaliphilus]|uniref:Uncharacterized protein n=1 Tax=Algoriphagus alkaliphilus TaxID=279824 RepID=A0A1G5XFC5_9BACT|nr:hypothetical protein [Algoriphagus alkaliphilus]MBA4300195.1 hypothetical protein [Cyclobacterium sp.]SDA68646.1 hypothetical protein SAMN03080617_01698 [Algoriphagus alkaliphilus]